MAFVGRLCSIVCLTLCSKPLRFRTEEISLFPLKTHELTTFQARVSNNKAAINFEIRGCIETPEVAGLGSNTYPGEPL